MENFFTRYKNPLVLMTILFVQVVALATQVKRPEGGKGAAASGGTRLIRVWTVTAISPFERALVGTGAFVRRNFHNYIDLHNVRKQNHQLEDEVAQLKLEQVRLRQDAEQAKRLQALLGFTQHYLGQVVPAQVIGTSGVLQSHIIQIDKGSKSGIRVDMPVITPDGIVGKVKDVYPYTAQVLMISDRDSGAGVILQNSRLQGILRGSPQGELHVSDIMSDEKIDVGEQVVTSGGDRIYPKGLPVGTVTQVSPDRDNDPFLAIRVKPATDLNRLEEVLVVTHVAEEVPEPGSTSNLRAADILSERLPSVPKPDESKKAGAPKAGAGTAPAPPPQAGAASPGRPAGTPMETKKPSTAALKSGDTAPKKGSGEAAAVPGASPPANPQTKALKAVKTAIGPDEQKKGTALAAEKKAANPSPGQATARPSPAKMPGAAGQASSAGSASTGQKNTPASGAATPPGNVAAGAQKPKPAASPVKKVKPQATPSPTAAPDQTETTNPAPAQPPANPETPPR